MSLTDSLVVRAVGLGGRAHSLLGAAWRRKQNLAPPVLRRQFFDSVPPAAETLEIGPLDAPVLRGDNVSYFDRLDTESLRRLAVELGRRAEDCPRIHYHSETGDLSVIDRRFDGVISSHMIEHHPNLVAHLAAVSKLLRPGGRYFLAIPDRRYCFDHFADDSDLDEVLSAHYEGRERPSEGAIRRYYARHTHNNAVQHWLGRHGALGRETAPEQIEHVRSACEQARAGHYVDVHCWAFTPSTFLAIIESLHREGLTDLGPERVHDTRFGALEFYAVLAKG